MSIKNNVFYNLIKTFSLILFPLITFPYVSRTLLPENVGKINFGLSFVSYFSLLATLGITTYAIRECSAVRDNKIKLTNIASQIYSISIISSSIAYILLFFIVFGFSELDSYRILITIQSISIIAVTIGADWINAALEDFKYITYRTILFQLLSLVLIFSFVHSSNDYLLFAVISLVSSCGASLTNIFHRKKYCNIKMVRNIFQGIEWKRHLPPILYLFVMMFSQTIFTSVDHTMLGLMHGDYEVGIYTTACKIANLINQLVASILWVIIPRMSYYFAQKKYDEINDLLRKILGLNFTIGIPSAIGCYVLSDDIVILLAGNSFIESSQVLRILMIGFLISLVGGNFLGNAVLIPSGREKYYMVVCVITAIANIFGNYFLIARFGANGAAVTTTICSLIILALLFLKVDHNIHIKNKLSLVISPLVGSFFIIIVCLLCRNIEDIYLRIIISFVSCFLIYSFVIIFMKNEHALIVLSYLKKSR